MFFQTPYHLGGRGRKGSDLAESQLSLVQRFTPNTQHSVSDDEHRDEYATNMSYVDTDTIGFFIAKFIKKAS